MSNDTWIDDDGNTLDIYSLDEISDPVTIELQINNQYFYMTKQQFEEFCATAGDLLDE